MDIDYKAVFSGKVMARIFPADRTDRFFDALFGDPAEGAFDIRLEYDGNNGNQLSFTFKLRQRPGKCLVCNLTYGLPQVFERHPVIDLGGIIKNIEKRMGGELQCDRWELGSTRELSREFHVIPLTLTLHKKHSKES